MLRNTESIPPVPTQHRIDMKQKIRQEDDLSVWDKVKAGETVVWLGANGEFIKAEVISGSGSSPIRLRDFHDNSTGQIWVEQIVAIEQNDALCATARYVNGIDANKMLEALSAARTFKHLSVVEMLPNNKYRVFPMSVEAMSGLYTVV